MRNMSNLFFLVDYCLYIKYYIYLCGVINKSK